MTMTMDDRIWPLSDSQIAEFHIGGNECFTPEQKIMLMSVGKVFVSDRTKKGLEGKNGYVCVDEIYLFITDNSFPIFEELINLIGEIKPDELWVEDKYSKPGERVIRMWWD